MDPRRAMTSFALPSLPSHLLVALSTLSKYLHASKMARVPVIGRLFWYEARIHPDNMRLTAAKVRVPGPRSVADPRSPRDSHSSNHLLPA